MSRETPDRINAAIRAAGVVWHACLRCRRDWPFPTGGHNDREYLCVVCVDSERSAVSCALAGVQHQVQAMIDADSQLVRRHTLREVLAVIEHALRAQKGEV